MLMRGGGRGEQPLPDAVSPNADSLVYIADSNLEDPEEDPKEDPTNYPVNRGDDDESSDDDEDDDNVEEDEDEEEADRPEVCLPPQKRLCIALGLRYQVDESSSAPTARPTGGFRADYGFIATLYDEIRHDPERDVGYGITNTWDEMLVGMPGAPATKGTKLGQRITNFVTSVRQDTNEIYGRLNEAHDARAMLSGESTEDYCIGIADGDCSVMSSRPRSTGTACGDTKTDKYTADIGDSTAGIARTRWRSSTARDTGGDW
ncbi:hypothetical protein Tco_0475999 [Tanacetum coccineum]